MFFVAALGLLCRSLPASEIMASNPGAREVTVMVSDLEIFVLVGASTSRVAASSKQEFLYGFRVQALTVWAN